MKTTNNNPIVPIVPAVIYTNADTQKKRILEENKAKSGVYRWTNLTNGNSYIGSGVNLSIRLSHYYSQKRMDHLRRNRCSTQKR